MACGGGRRLWRAAVAVVVRGGEGRLWYGVVRRFGRMIIFLLLPPPTIRASLNWTEFGVWTVRSL